MLSNKLSKSYSVALSDRILSLYDPAIYKIHTNEIKRQKKGIELIASENYPSRACLAALSTHFNNKYAEGYPGARYYGGTKYVDELENETKNRALQLFGLNSNNWGVNVQPLSGTPANMAVYTALLKPGETLMGLKLSDGGHLTHGHKTSKKNVSASSIFWNSQPYTVNQKTCLIDYDNLDNLAIIHKPKIIIAGASAYPRFIDFKRFREICDHNNSILMSDVSHYSGLIAANLYPSPFEHSDIVTTTTHKTLRGPRGAMIFFRKKYEKAINSAVFPALQGGPHLHQIAAIAVALKEANSKNFVDYQKQVLKNVKALCKALIKSDIKIVTDGTDIHMALIDLRGKGADGARVEYVLDLMGISVNKNTIPGGSLGLRVGSPAMTSRGMKELDFKKIANYIVKGIKIAANINQNAGKKLSDFKKLAKENKDIPALKKEVTKFASSFPLPGYDD
uniref:Serine hydroxymethyltransferase n=2 Tax=Trichomonas tenax TaxID=43075 RepID=A0A7H4L1D8_9EUKA|nr:serine hydromethyltransferase [Trichomonas tenax]